MNRRVKTEIMMLIILLAGIIGWNHTNKLNNMNKTAKQSVQISVGEEKEVFNELKIKYISFGHEHSSSGPDEPFAADVGLYSFEFDLGDKKETGTIYQGVGYSSAPYKVGRFSIVVLPINGGQEKITLEISAEDSRAD